MNERKDAVLYPQVSAIREKIDLSGLWDFTVDPEDIGKGEKWYEGLKSPVDIAVPGSWNEQFLSEDFPGVDIKNYLGAAWYQKRFFIPSAWDGRRIWLRIGAANYRAKVWVNGVLMGEGEGGYFPFEFETGGAAKRGEENLLVVRVNNELSQTTLPQDGSGFAWEFFPKCRTDYFPYGGIHRPVILYSTPESYIKHVTVNTDIDGSRGIVKYVVETGGPDVAECLVSLKGDKEELEQRQIVANGRASGEIVVNDADLWCPENPFLYDFRVQLIDGEKAVDEYELQIGIRTIEAREDGLFLNGRRILLRGIGKHGQETGPPLLLCS